MCTQCRECFYGSNCLLVDRDIWFSCYKNRHPTLVWRTPLQITPFLDWSIKTGVGLDWMFLYKWHCEQGVGTVDWWENMHLRSPTAASFWQVYDEHWSWLSDYRCLVTVSLFLFVNHCQEQGYSHCRTASMVNAV